MGGAAIVCYLVPLDAGRIPSAVKHGARHRVLAARAQSPLHAFNCRSSTVVHLQLRPVLPMALVGAVLLSAAIHLVAVLVPRCGRCSRRSR